MNRLHISRLLPADRPALMEMLASDDDFPDDAVGFYRYQRPPYEDLVAWWDDQIVGMLTAHVRTNFAGNDAFNEFDLPPGPHSFLSRIFVTQAARGQRIGLALVRELAHEASRHGSTFIAGSIDRSSDARARRRFFTLAGFTLTPSDQFGAPTDDVIRKTSRG